MRVAQGPAAGATCRAPSLRAVDDARAKRLTLIACILGSAIVFVDQTVVNVALPALRDDLDASLADQQWVVESYLLLLASLVLVGGSLGDLYGRRRIFAIGVAGFGVGVARLRDRAVGRAADRGARAAGRVRRAARAELAGDHHDGLRARRAARRRSARGRPGTSAAIAVGPPLGGLLVDALSWRVIFAMNVPLVLVCLWLIVRARAGVPRRRRAPHRRAGRRPLRARPRGAGVRADPAAAARLVGPVGVGAARRRPRRAAARSSPTSAARPTRCCRWRSSASRNFAVGNAVTFVVYAGLGAATFFIALFLQQVAGYTRVRGRAVAAADHAAARDARRAASGRCRRASARGCS